MATFILGFHDFLVIYSVEVYYSFKYAHSMLEGLVFVKSSSYHDEGGILGAQIWTLPMSQHFDLEKITTELSSDSYI